MRVVAQNSSYSAAPLCCLLSAAAAAGLYGHLIEAIHSRSLSANKTKLKAHFCY